MRYEQFQIAWSLSRVSNKS